MSIGFQTLYVFLYPPEGSIEVDDEAVTCFSCEYMCGWRGDMWSGPPQCYCDHQCLLYGDCCYDYRLHCHGNSPTVDRMDIDNITTSTALQTIIDNVDARARYDLECLPIPIATNVFVAGSANVKWHLMVDKCRENILPEYLDAKTKCEEDNVAMSLDVSVKTPVLYNDFFYKNYHCVVCNVGKVNQSDVTYTDPNYECLNDTNVAIAKELYFTQPFQVFQQFLAANCRFYVQLLSLEGLFPGANHAHSCKTNRIRSCDQSRFIGRMDEFQYYENYCNIYESTVASYTDNGTKVMFKNPHCAACNGYYNVSCRRKEYSKSVGRGGIPSFSLLMDFEETKDPELLFNGNRYCTSKQYLDFTNDICIDNPCPSGQVRLSGTCTKLNISSTPPNLNRTISSFVVLIKLQLVPDLAGKDILNAVENFAADLFDALYWRRIIEQLIPDLECAYDLETFTPSSDMNTTNTTTTRYSCIIAHVGRRGYQFPLSKWTIRDWERKLSKQLQEPHANISHVTFKYLLFFPTPKGHEICQSGRLVMSRNLVFSKVVDLDAFQPDYLLENNTGLWYSYDDAHLGVEMSINSELEQEMIYFGLFCQPDILFCDRTVLDTDTLSLPWSINGSSLWVGEIEVMEGSFVHMIAGKFLLCREAMELIRKQFPEEPQSLDSLVQGILTLIGNVLSIAFLVFTFITYTLFPSMRTVPGICIMNLCVSLSLAQLLFQLSPLFTNLNVVCSVMAAIQHYMWLVSFLWMNVLAYVTFKTFSEMKVIQSQSASKGRRYMIYSWILPLVFVLLCVLVDNFTTFDFSYGSSTHCWLYGKYGLIYLFAVPLAVIICANLIMFSRTLVAIKRTMDQTKMAKEGKDDQKQFGIYVKLSSVMGFTWVFGFLANLTVFTAFWYVFIVLNTLQGVFIGISFVFNRRVMRRYKALLIGKAVETSSATKRTTVAVSTSSATY